MADIVWALFEECRRKKIPLTKSGLYAGCHMCESEGKEITPTHKYVNPLCANCERPFCFEHAPNDASTICTECSKRVA